MIIKYFTDSDTLLLILSDHDVIETRNANENTILEFDQEGNIVSITIEHAKVKSDISSIPFEQENFETNYEWESFLEEEKFQQSWLVTIFREDIANFIRSDNAELKKMFTFVRDERFYTEKMKNRLKKLKIFIKQ